MLRCRSVFVAVLIGSVLRAGLFAQEALEDHAPAEEKSATAQIDLKKVSEAYGHLIGKSLNTLGFELNVYQVVKGIQDAIAGKESPMGDSECVRAISLVQEEVFQKAAADNLKKADEFMLQNAKNKGVIELETNKLQYKVEQLGEGALVENHSSPMVRYSGKFIDGKIFNVSQEDELLSLDETLQGISQGVVGMREGERRTIYIHPDFGYGLSDFLPPNSALIFDIEVIKANEQAAAEEEPLPPVADEVMGDLPELTHEETHLR